jgi:hypothetical protein
MGEVCMYANFLSVLAAVLAALLLPASCERISAVETRSDKINPEALALIRLTKSPTISYMNYIWNEGNKSSGKISEWSAEFHHDVSHRVETPGIRVIADCRSGAGAYMSLTDNILRRGDNVAAGACGIDTSQRILAASITASLDTKFGPAKRIVVRDYRNTRTYDISSEGIILRAVYVDNATSRSLLESYSVAVVKGPVEEDMFGETSLARSFVPSSYQIKPK